MFLKHYRSVRFRVPDPLHPGHSVFDQRLDWSGTHSLTHEGVTYDADADGWFDLPPEVAAHFASFPGWRTPEQVDEDRSAGFIRRDSGTGPDPRDTEIAQLRQQLEEANALAAAATSSGKKGGKE